MDSSREKDKTSTDPFAGDIFAESHSAESANTKIGEQETSAGKPSWTRILPKAELSQVNWNKFYRNLSADFSEKLPRRLEESFSNLIGAQGNLKSEIIFINEREINRPADVPMINPDSWWLTIGIEGAAAEIFIEIGNVFAGWLVDSMLAEKPLDAPQIRRLTPSEAAVIEYAALQFTADANDALQSPLFVFRRLEHRLPPVLVGKFESSKPSLLIGEWQITYNNQASIAKIYVSPELLAALQPAENRLLALSPSQANWTRYKTRAENLPMRINCGMAELTVEELSALAKGDIVLLQTTPFTINQTKILGRLEIFLGDDRETIVAANIDAPRNSGEMENRFPNDSRKIVNPINADLFRQIFVTNILQIEKSDSFKKNMLEENETPPQPNEDTEQISETGLKIENIGLTLRVELEARRLTLEEAAQLKVNGVLDLGVSPTDSVNLLINDKIIGRGELVEIENRLGVRILSLLN